VGSEKKDEDVLVAFVGVDEDVQPAPVAKTASAATTAQILPMPGDGSWPSPRSTGERHTQRGGVAALQPRPGFAASWPGLRSMLAYRAHKRVGQ
jgi:hypothetical protein